MNTPQSLRPLGDNGTNDSTCNGYSYDPSCDVTTTTTTPLPYDGVAGTPNATENVPSAPTADANATPTPTDATPATNDSRSPAPANDTTPTPRTHGLAIGTSPVDADGNPVRGAWGGWSARPGDTRAAGTNLIFVRNGNDSDTQFRVTFDAPAFVGMSDPSFLVPISGNVEFAVLELNGTIHRGDLSAASLAWGPGDLPTGITVTIRQPHDVAIVAYRIVAMPRLLLEQQYTASYHVGEVPT